MILIWMKYKIILEILYYKVHLMAPSLVTDGLVILLGLPPVALHLALLQPLHLSFYGPRLLALHGPSPWAVKRVAPVLWTFLPGPSLHPLGPSPLPTRDPIHRPSSNKLSVRHVPSANKLSIRHVHVVPVSVPGAGGWSALFRTAASLKFISTVLLIMFGLATSVTISHINFVPLGL